MKFGCVPMIYFKQLVLDKSMTLDQWLDVAKTLPIDATEIHDQSLASRDPQYLSQLKQKLEETNIRVSQFTAAPDYTSPNANYRQAMIEKTKADVDVAAFLGATCVRVTAGQVYPSVEREQGIQYVVESLKPALEYAYQKGVFLAYENHYKDYFWNYPDFSQRSEVFLEIARRLRPYGIRVNYDCGNQVMISEDPIPVLKEVKDLVVHVHCSDRFAGEYRHTVATEGATPFREIFEILSAEGYDRWLSIEYNGTGGLEGLDASIRNIRKLWTEVTGK